MDGHRSFRPQVTDRRMVPRRNERSIRRALHSQRPAIQHVGVHHGRADILVTEQLLNGAYVVAVLQEMRGKTVPQRIRTLPMNLPQPRFTTVTIRSTANT